ncbi:hypothetical protein A2291_05880 [candidate division WOR-1 bacterium RIFOXYB2_FULL_42_35]|uniref:Excinuclease ABC subunit C n=1 Tax=candidate division WOR-1 bacterium RIFOXYC2_FULL_41_25 TaxID=1802586 RepID=A0A1F4TK77_UNCSA|nr:MAG: hypothetical protein A2247_02520 [candidate division WOR-1 bacterium RIFOXYA2_FULL_41_14]OGC22452.1 MAG: hypothetical protein A2291_05880 [candidate division WOR-1 bacterium RIFOXYB2_FULL_42_35]OGC33132.1 MAG: hypothetical protein A2462_08790 [candidate division WOR-1 bacterium RIFOXYC2_FULL_41_25]
MKSLPDKPGVYLFKDNKGLIIYVGKAKSLRKRVASYFQPHDDIKTQILAGRLRDVEYIATGSESDALILEDRLIKKYQPRYNISLKDDKTYPSLKLTIHEEWPRLLFVRKKEQDGSLYFGPFPGGVAREAILLVKKIFPIRWCKESPLKKRQQPCLFYRIGNCSGPCIGKICRKDYLNLIRGILLLLKGKSDKALKKLNQEMKKASRVLDYEMAAYLRDKIKTLQKLLEGQGLRKAPVPLNLADLTELKTVLRLRKSPLRIEAFDVSNISGSNMVGAMVVFYGGIPLKKDYRRFKIRSVEDKPNDVAAILEVIKRRYTLSLSKRLPLPDLILVDGGHAQVNAAKQALKEAGLTSLPMIGLAKREETICFASGEDLKLPKTSAALRLLQRVRDEVHRFAITFHREKRKKSLFAN